jgi:hypothetical protein
MTDNVVKMPQPPEPPELLVGPFKEWRVRVDGRMIPKLTGSHEENGRVFLVVDNRYGASFAKEDAYQAAWLIAQAMAIGAGYPHLGAESKAMPFAPLGSEIVL